MFDLYFRNLLDASYQHPHFAWGLVLLPLVAFLLRHKVNRGPSRTSWRYPFSALFLRLLALALVILALCSPQVTETNDSKKLVVLADVSSSITKDGKEQLANMASQLLSGSDPESEIEFVAFAGDYSTSSNRIAQTQINSSKIVEIMDKQSQGLSVDQTNIEQALEQVANSRSVPSIVLLSDGQENQGSSLELAKHGELQDKMVFPLAPPALAFENPKVTLVSLDVPNVIDTGKTAQIRAVIDNSFDRRESGRLKVYADDTLILSRNLTIESKSDALVTLDSPVLEGGLHRIRATFELDSPSPQTSEMHSWLSVKKRSKVLLISGSEQDARVMSKLLEFKGHPTENFIANGRKALPKNLSEYLNVIVNNTARRQLSDTFLSELERYVKSGGGALLIGGERSFGLGEYIDTPLETISPLKFLPPATTKRRLNNAVALVIDKSRSMTDENRIVSAREAALTAINALQDDDFVSVIGFDSTPFVLIRMKPVPEAKQSAAGRLRNLTAAGRTNLLPALTLARKALTGAPASRKHIIILSDGQVPVLGGEYQNEMASMRSEDITLSAVALGQQADVPFMKMLSSLGKGAFYHTLDPSRLPQIFLEDIKVTTGEKTIKEQSKFNIAVGPAGLVSTRISQYPYLKGFVSTLPKKGSRLELITRKQKDTFPILASWQYGKGQVIAFTSDVNGRWSGPWMKWKGFSVFWGSLLDASKSQIANKATEVDFSLRHIVSGDSLSFDLAIYDQKLRSEVAPPIKANITAPGNEVSLHEFSSVAKGRFALKLNHVRTGDYNIKILYGDVSLPPLAVTIPPGIFGEHPGEGLNISILSSLAHLSGGKINPSPSDLRWATKETTGTKNLAFPLLLSAIFLILADAFIRERSM